MIHIPSFEQFIDRTLGPRERDIIAWLDWARRLTGRLAALVHDPGARYAPLILAYLDWLAYATGDTFRDHLILAPCRRDARTLADWCTQWPSRAGALSRHRTVARPGETYPRTLIIDAHLAARRGRRDTLSQAIGTVFDSYGPDYTDHAIVLLGDARAAGTTFAELYRAAPMQPDSWFIYDTAAPILGPPPDIDPREENSPPLVGTCFCTSAPGWPVSHPAIKAKMAIMAIKAKEAIPPPKIPLY